MTDVQAGSFMLILRSVALPALLAKKTALALWTSTGFLMVALIDPTTVATAVGTVIGALTGAALIVIPVVTKARKEILEAKAELLAGQAALLEAQSHMTTAVNTVKASVDGMQTAAVAKHTAETDASEAKRATDENTILALRQENNELRKTAQMLAQARSIADAVAVSQTPISIHTEGEKR